MGRKTRIETFCKMKYSCYLIYGINQLPHRQIRTYTMTERPR
jgi:hypothetical protein